MAAMGALRIELTSLVVDHLQLDFTPLIHSFGHSGLAASVLDFLMPGSMLTIRGLS